MKPEDLLKLVEAFKKIIEEIINKEKKKRV